MNEGITTSLKLMRRVGEEGEEKRGSSVAQLQAAVKVHRKVAQLGKLTIYGLGLKDLKFKNNSGYSGKDIHRTLRNHKRRLNDIP